MTNFITTSTVLTGTTLVSALGGLTLPITITLKSADITRKIELSSDGIEYFSPQLDKVSTTMLMVVLNAGVSTIRVTGAISDTLVIVSQ